MKVTMLLADYAQVADGKLTVVGGGWSLTGPEPSPFGIAILVHVPWDQANRRHTLRLELVDADGVPVTVPGDDGEEEPVVFLNDVEFEVGRPAGIKPGTPLELPLGVNSGPLPLEPGGRYEWRLSINGESDGGLAPRLQRPRRGRAGVATAVVPVRRAMRSVARGRWCLAGRARLCLAPTVSLGFGRGGRGFASPLRVWRLCA